MSKPRVLESIDNLEKNKSDKSTSYTELLSASFWSNNSYKLFNQVITATSIVELYPNPNITSDQLEALQGAMIIDIAQASGYITLKAMGDVPTVDIPIIIVVRGDM